MPTPAIACFSMEIALQSDIPTYSGGLGVLAGDTIQSAADAGVPMVAVTLLHRKGHFCQHLDASGWQTETPVEWDVEGHLTELPQHLTVTIEGRPVRIRAWRKDVAGISGQIVSVYLLDTDLPENTQGDGELTHYLYGGDSRYRLCQEVLLGIGGLRLLRSLGLFQLRWFHFNEGHAALLTLELLEERRRAAGHAEIVDEDIEEVRRQCVFTTHTPVAAGHDRFPLSLAQSVLGDRPEFRHDKIFCCDGQLNLTFLALNLCHYVNGVAKRHRDVSRLMFPNRQIDSITNGVHAQRWTSPSMQHAFDEFVPDWREDNFSLRSALRIPDTAIRTAHQSAKQTLIDRIRDSTGEIFDPQTFTIGFDRRVTAYKRTDLLFHNVERLRSIGAACGSTQIVFAGKAHPRGDGGKHLIQRLFEAARQLKGDVNIVYLPNYDMALAQQMVSGVDLWLNTPQPPLEASGTSGMKAALNGVPSLSVMDGWWLEGCVEGVTGWAIGTDHGTAATATNAEHVDSLYDKLEHQILPMFHNEPHRFSEVMRHAIALNGSFFNTQRMIQQYALKAYLL